MRITLPRDLWPWFTTIAFFWDFQFFGQKTTQSGIRFSFRRRAAHFDLNRVAVLADYLVDLGIRSDVESESSHQLRVAAVYDRRIR